MVPPINERGKRYGFLTVLYPGNSTNAGKKTWICQCDCGNLTGALVGSDLRQSKVKSCGCKLSELSRLVHLTHGHSKTKPYKVYHSAKRRCESIKDRRFKDYGGRGIEFLFESF